MTINDNLEIVFDIRTDEANRPTLRIFHRTISRDVFEINYKLLSAVFSELWSQGSYHALSVGPRIASLALKDLAKKMAESLPDDSGTAPNPAHTLLEEMKRLSLILVPTPSGWEKIPVQTALSRHLIDEEEWSEVESALIFFTSAYHLAKKSEKEVRANVLLGLLGAKIYSDSTDLPGSSRISTASETTPVKTASSVPY